MMKTVLFFAGLIAVALGGAIPSHEETYEFKHVDNDFVLRQRKVLNLLEHITQINPDAEYYKTGKEFDIEANVEHYTNQKAVQEFLLYFRHGMLPFGHVFSIFNEKMRDEAIALYHLFFYAKDFETFYKTACWARVHLNEGLFTYSFSIAVMHRPDTRGIVLPAPYEIYPYYFVNSDVIVRMHGLKMQRGAMPDHVTKILGIEREEDHFTIHANYTGWLSTVNTEDRLSYFTEDIGLNTYYYYFHARYPFWMTGEEYGAIRERRGERYFYFFQQLLARYYMERLTNGLGEIPQFTWRWPIKTGYMPNMVDHNSIPFVQRNNYYQIHNEDNVHDLEFLESYEQQFLEYLEQGHFKAYNMDVDMRNSKSVNFVGNFWESNVDLYHKAGGRNYEQYYYILASMLLGASPNTATKYDAAPVALENFQTALRDPIFFQLYKRVMYYFLQYKQYLEPYTTENLHFVGVKVNDVKVDRLETFFDYFYFNATNAVFYSKEELKDIPYYFTVRQPRLNHKPFSVNIDIKSDVATDAMVKIFLAPKYDSDGHEYSIENNWMHFVELDWFKHKLTPGKNTIVRKSEDFFFYKDDSISAAELHHFLDSGKVPTDMSDYFDDMPSRLMLPKGTKGGYPFQIFVMVYPFVEVPQELEQYKNYILDNKPFGYPFDRPVNELYFYQPNMHFEDVFIYHDGEEFVYKYNVPHFEHSQNVVNKH